MKKEKRPFSESLSAIYKRMKNGTLKDVWTDWKWIFRFTRRHKGSIILYTLFGIFSSILSLVTGIAGKHLIDAIIALDLSKLFFLILILGSSALVTIVFRSLASRFSAKLSIDMQNDVQACAFDALISSDWMAIRKYPTGDLLNRFQSDVQQVATCAVSWLPNAIIQIITALATLAVIIYYDPMMAVICCASAPVLFFISNRLIKEQRDHNKNMREAQSGISSFEAETFRNIDTLKSFGIEQNVSRDLRGWQEKNKDAALSYNKFTIKTNVILTVSSTAIQYLALAYCLWQLWRGEILIGTLVFFLQQRASLTTAFSSIISLIPSALSGSVSAERVRELTLLSKEKPTDNDAATPAGASIYLEGVRVAYDDGERILSHIEFSAKRGEVVALVGPSGEGKTTLIRLLLGLIRPSKGQLYMIDDKGQRRELGAETRNCFAYVPQGNTVIAGTVASNLRLGREDATDEEMIEALKGAAAWDFVSEMPFRLYAEIGEGGKGLSEGQAQRISIARALLRRTPVMLLDEVTSALDITTAKQVLDYLTSRGVTCILTTHRPSVLTLCDRVYRVENNRVTQLSEDEVRDASTVV